MTRAAAVALLLVSASASARGAQDAPDGAYTGTYDCAQGATGLSLSMTTAADGGVSALFHFYALPGNPAVPEGCFAMHGRWDARTGAVRLAAGAWLLRPPLFVTVDLTGRLIGGVLSGDVIGPGCTSFSLRADPDPPSPPTACAAGGSAPNSI